MLLLPIFFLPLSVDAYGFGKNWLLLVTGLIGLVIWSIKLLTSKKPAVKVNMVWWLMLALGVWSVISWWRLPDGVRMTAIMNPAALGTLVGLLMWTFLWLQTNSEEERKWQLNWLTVAGVVVAISSIVVFMIPSAKLPINWPKSNPMLSISNGWSLVGSLLSELILVVFLLLEWVKKLVAKLKGSDYIVEAVVVGIMGVVLFLDIYKVTKIGWLVLDGNTGWTVAAEVFKRSPIFGVGTGNFVQAFNMYRPATYNLTKFWTNGFATSTNAALELWTELGLVGVVLGLMMGLQVLKKRRNTAEFYGVLILGLIVVFSPVNLIGLVLISWMLMGEMFGESKLSLEWRPEQLNGFNVPAGIALMLTMVSLGMGGYWMGKILLGEYYLRQSLVAAAKNDGGNTYNLQIKAIASDPYLAEYRRIYSQTNLALAKTMLSNKDITDDDKQKASVLIQQAVREAKASIALNNADPDKWLNLAGIYKELIGVVDGSADWSYQAYAQAVALNPTDPMSGLDLGGLLYAAGRYEEADRVFEQVVTNKADFANGWYNWAYSAKKLNKLPDAVNRLSQAVSLVPATSGDYDKASAELVTWKKEYDDAVKKYNEQVKQQQEQQKQAETLSTQEPLPTGTAASKIAVPTGDIQPPAVATPSPTQ